MRLGARREARGARGSGRGAGILPVRGGRTSNCQAGPGVGSAETPLQQGMAGVVVSGSLSVRHGVGTDKRCIQVVHGYFFILGTIEGTVTNLAEAVGPKETKARLRSRCVATGGFVPAAAARRLHGGAAAGGNN